MKPENREKCNWEEHIYYNPHGNLPFRVTMKVNGKLKHFSTFKELNDAVAVRDKILKQYPHNMNNDILAIISSTFEIVMWPEIQEYMVIEGFKENAMLINEQPFINFVGSSAYFINSNWKKKADIKIAYENGHTDAQYEI